MSTVFNNYLQSCMHVLIVVIRTYIETFLLYMLELVKECHGKLFILTSLFLTLFLKNINVTSLFVMRLSFRIIERYFKVSN